MKLLPTSIIPEPFFNLDCISFFLKRARIKNLINNYNISYCKTQEMYFLSFQNI